MLDYAHPRRPARGLRHRDGLHPCRIPARQRTSLFRLSGATRPHRPPSRPHLPFSARPRKFAALVEQDSMARGIGVIVDWVPAHFPTDAHVRSAIFDGTALYEHAGPPPGFPPGLEHAVYNFGRREVLANFLRRLPRPYWLKNLHVDAACAVGCPWPSMAPLPLSLLPQRGRMDSQPLRRAREPRAIDFLKGS